jgi:flagellar assembly factor FliW
MEDFLTNEEKQAIKVLNFTATFDGIIESEDDIRFMLEKGIEKFIPKKRQHLVSITETAYPIRIKY